MEDEELVKLCSAAGDALGDEEEAAIRKAIELSKEEAAMELDDEEEQLQKALSASLMAQEVHHDETSDAEEEQGVETDTPWFESYSLSPPCGDVPVFMDDEADGRALYELVAVVSHTGKRYTSGHFVCDVLEDGEWTTFDDSVATKVHGR